MERLESHFAFLWKKKSLQFTKHRKFEIAFSRNVCLGVVTLLYPCCSFLSISTILIVPTGHCGDLEACLLQWTSMILRLGKLPLSLASF